MIVLDASVLIGFLDDHDNHHAAAKQLLTGSVAALGALEVAELAFPADTAVRLAQLRVTTGLKLPDCCVILAAEDAGARVASFDDRLAQVGERRNLTVGRR